MNFNLDAIFEEQVGYLKIEHCSNNTTLVTISSTCLEHIVHWDEILYSQEVDILRNNSRIENKEFGFKILDDGRYERTLKILHT